MRMDFPDPREWAFLLRGVSHCLLTLLAYLLPALLVLLPLRFLTRIPSFVFRKLLHGFAFTCICLMISSSPDCPSAAATALLLALSIYPILSLLENRPWYGMLFVEKTKGEVKRSMLMLFFMFAFLILLCWGLFGQRRLCAMAILMWGTGDAAAALVGIPFGQHKVNSPWTDGKKSWEGSLAMLLVSFLAGLILLLPGESFSFRGLFAVLGGALLGTLTELLSPSQYDTVTVPVVIAAVLLLFYAL